MATLALLFAMLATAQAAPDPEPLDDNALDRLVASAERRFAEPSIDREAQGKFALDVAGRIDAAARAEPAAGARAVRWDRAVDLLDSFLRADPGNPLASSIALQAGVYRWAEGRTWANQLERAPGDAGARSEAIEALDDAIARLRRLWSQTNRLPDGDLMAQNVRYRFAQALADRADLESDPARALDARQQALGRLRDLPSEPPLAGHAALLKARLLVLVDQPQQAEEAFREAADQPGPSEAERIDTHVAILVARKQFDEAIAVIERAELDRPSKDARAVRVRSRQWIDLFPGRERSEVEADAISRVRRLRNAEHPDAGSALASLAGTILEPDQTDDPGLWELLAEGHLARGDVAQAVRLNQAGADHAERLGDPGRAWVMRYRAAAVLVRAGRNAEAAEALTPIAEQARTAGGPAPEEQRAGASLLHALAVGKLASAAPAGGRPDQFASYESALRRHIECFPDDPTASEARWILGKLRASGGDHRGALSLWAVIPPDHPRWREARLASLDLHREAIEELAAAGRHAEARERLAEARALADTGTADASQPADRNAIELARAEMELIPGLGSATEALERLDRLVASEVIAEQRDRARRLRIVAQASAQRHAEAERNAREELERSGPEEIVALATRLDRIASMLPDPEKRRVAGVARMLTERVLARSDALDPGIRSQARVLRIRGQLDTGDLDGARRSAESWAAELDPAGLPPHLIAPLAEALDRLGLYQPAAEAHRVVISKSPPGSRPWFEARYGLAVAYYRSGRQADARRLIDGTIALHPDLGGDDLKEKFTRLRRRLESP